MDNDSHSHRWFNPKPKEATTFTSSLWSVRERAREIKFWLFWFFIFLQCVWFVSLNISVQCLNTEH